MKTIFFTFFFVIISTYFASTNRQDTCIQDDLQHRKPDFNLKQYQNKYIETTATVEYKKIDGIEPLYLSLDIYKPYSQNKELQHRPVIVFFHDGGWNSQNKQDLYTAGKVVWALQRGYLFVSVNHRLASFELITETDPDINNFKKRVMIDRIHQDAVDAVVWVYHNIVDYGGDPNNILLFGFSSGADIVARLGLSTQTWMAHQLPTNFIKGVVVGDISTFDLKQSILDEQKKFINKEKNIYNYYLNVFGLDEKYWQKYTAQEKIKKAVDIPAYFMIRTDEKYLIQNKLVTDNFIKKIKEKKVEVLDVTVHETEHHEVYRMMLTDPSSELNKQLTQFIEKHLGH